MLGPPLLRQYKLLVHTIYENKHQLRITCWIVVIIYLYLILFTNIYIYKCIVQCNYVTYQNYSKLKKGQTVIRSDLIEVISKGTGNRQIENRK